MRKARYPGLHEAEQERHRAGRRTPEDSAPDWIAGAPNYDKYPNHTPEEVLVMLNID